MRRAVHPLLRVRRYCGFVEQNEGDAFHLVFRAIEDAVQVNPPPNPRGQADNPSTGAGVRKQEHTPDTDTPHRAKQISVFLCQQCSWDAAA